MDAFLFAGTAIISYMYSSLRCDIPYADDEAYDLDNKLFQTRDIKPKGSKSVQPLQLIHLYAVYPFNYVEASLVSSLSPSLQMVGVPEQ